MSFSSAQQSDYFHPVAIEATWPEQDSTMKLGTFRSVPAELIEKRATASRSAAVMGRRTLAV
jgi:hypothetical protein